MIEITSNGLSKDQRLRCYVNMHRIFTIINHAFVIESKNMVENLEQLSLNETIQFKNSKGSIQEALAHHCHNLLSLRHLPSRRTNGRKPLMDYSQSHVVTLEKYLSINNEMHWIRR